MKVDVQRQPSPPTRIVIRDAHGKPVVVVDTVEGADPPQLLVHPQAGAGAASLDPDDVVLLTRALEEMSGRPL